MEEGERAKMEVILGSLWKQNAHHLRENTMHYIILRVVFFFVFVPFLFSGVIAFAAQAKADAKNPLEQCIKGGKPFSNAKTKNECIDKGGAWVNVKAPMRPPDPLGKGTAMPPANR